MYRIRYRSTDGKDKYKWVGLKKDPLSSEEGVIVLVADPKKAIEYASFYGTTDLDRLRDFDGYVWHGVEKISREEVLNRIAEELSYLTSSNMDDRLYRGI